MRQSLVLTAALLSETLVSAQCPNGSCQAVAPPAIVRVIHTLGPCRSFGSGTIVHDDGPRTVVLSCAHLFRDGIGCVQVRLPNGRTVDARPCGIDTTSDLSALEIDSTGITPIKLATTVPRPGEQLQSCGFGPNGLYRCSTGTVQGYARTSNTKTCETLCLTGSARDGDSGGPVLNRQGELVGVLWGTDGRTVHATYCGRIRKFLASLLPTFGVSQPAQRAPPTSEAPPFVAPADRPDPTANPVSQSEGPSRHDAEMASQNQRLETVLEAVAAIRNRLERLESRTPSTHVRSPTREPIRDSSPRSISSRVLAALPGLLTALGWTTPPSLALILALRVAWVILRRRAKRKHASKRNRLDSPSPLKPLNDRYANQLNEVYALSGRSTTADATLGREYDRQLHEMESAADDMVAQWARNLRRRVADRFLRIHDDSPMPAEPTGKHA